MPSRKYRADLLLHEQGLADSREAAKRLIMAGQVYLCLEDREIRVEKAGQALPEGSVLRVQQPQRFVSRGGGKLLGALEDFEIGVEGKICLDVGASTGGFTDCLLQMGALRVYALDVGTGQLHWKLRQDSRVVCLEQINIRKAPASLLPEKVQLAAIDCSFISLKQVMPCVMPFLQARAQVIALVKPQFEVGRGQTDKGVVRSPEAASRAVQGVIDALTGELALVLKGRTLSRIKGPMGNQEHLVFFLHEPFTH
ncbi:TlyA family RNA methyltransferase [Desulfonatronospira sp.]|uniref:TlyA family RNA methyltransferase n=1 Tax=Desulfonatronospira sp. TaxID=1962951 RepID=UPI0025C2B230|nr:TlyA family RNA methyltransferase [Desulfonatronospira sp.]